jgi:hypothetical protein
MKMRAQRQRHSLGWFAMTGLGASLLLAFAVWGVYTTVYRLSAGERHASASLLSEESAELTLVSREHRASRHYRPPVVETDETAAPAPPQAQEAARPVDAETKKARVEKPFIEARQERRDPAWAREMEWNVRDALGGLRDKQVALQSVQCASIRCTMEGSIGPGGRLEEVTMALAKVGLKRTRFKRHRDGDGTLTFSAVVARKGYKIDGLPEEETAKPL